MNNFITANDFKIDIALPLNVPQVIDSLNNDYIQKYQKEILIKLLGYTLYLQFDVGLSVASPAQKWLDLRDGCTYQDYDDNGVLQYVEFKGCKEIVKYYVYFFFLNDLQNKITPAGAIKQTLENAEVTNTTFKLFNGLEKLHELYGRNYSTTKKYFSTSDLMNNYKQCNISNYKLIGSAYNFITRQNELIVDTYPNWNFTELTKCNYITY